MTRYKLSDFKSFPVTDLCMYFITQATSRYRFRPHSLSPQWQSPGETEWPRNCQACSLEIRDCFHRGRSAGSQQGTLYGSRRLFHSHPLVSHSLESWKAASINSKCAPLEIPAIHCTQGRWLFLCQNYVSHFVIFHFVTPGDKFCVLLSL